MKFALIIGGILRCVHKNYEMIFKRIVDYYNCDIIIICQKHFDDDEERVKCFESKTIYKHVYEKPDPLEYFDSSGCLNNITNYSGQWNTYSNLQIFINMNEVGKIIKEEKFDYDYYLMFRTDAFILFDLPPKEIFSKIPKDVYGFCGECFGTIGNIGPHYIHKDYIYTLMTAPYNYINDSKNYNQLNNIVTHENLDKYKYFKDLILRNNGAKPENLLNYNELPVQEMLWIFAFESNNIFIKPIYTIPFYYNYDVNETNSYIYNDNNILLKHKDACYRYEKQFFEALRNNELYMDNYRYKVNDNSILLFK
jgi:hypothetical protein